MVDQNQTFLNTLNTHNINVAMNTWLINSVRFTTALKWLVNIRDSAERDQRRGGKSKDEIPPLSNEMPIIKDYQHYGIPDLPVDPQTGKGKVLNLFVVGCGARANGYLQALLLDYKTGESPYRVVGVADPIPTCRSRLIKLVREAGHNNAIAEYSCWQDVNNFDDLDTDIALIMTLDKDHADPAVHFMSKGCHVIVEKPLGTEPKEMDAMIDAMYRYNRIATVCTVLEYTSHARKLKDLISTFGSVEDLLIREQVGWHHDAYAFATGPYSNSNTTSPYTIAKTIHDMSMGLNLTDDSIESMMYIPSNSRANRGKYYNQRNVANAKQLEIFEPYSYLRKYTHKLIREMRANSPEIDEIIQALCEKNADGSYVLPIPSYNNVGDARLSLEQTIRVAELYRPFHVYLFGTNYWYNPMLYKEQDCDQPSGFTIVSNMSNGCQFKMICSPLSSKVCVRHYQIRCEGGEIISDTPDIHCTAFGTGGNDVALPKAECAVPDESNISKRTMHDGADAMFIHTIARKMADAVIQVNDFEAANDRAGLAEYVKNHPLNVHFERNAKLTNAILKATTKPFTLVKI